MKTYIISVSFEVWYSSSTNLLIKTEYPRCAAGVAHWLGLAAGNGTGNMVIGPTLPPPPPPVVKITISQMHAISG